MLNSGDVFAGFTIERLLGQGGMGSVYLARHPRLGKLTALKLLNRELYADREIRARFEREADLVARLDHPNIVEVYDRGTEDEMLWISMQYVDGVDAAGVNVATLPPERAVQVIEGVASALDYAHGMGVLHRDVKPANIILARAVAGHGERVFLTDFGIARLREDSTHLTQAGMFTATLAYASPEQMTGAHLDPTTDQYSLACALYWLLIGAGPYDSPHPGELIRGHLQLLPPPVSLRRPGLSPAMDAVLTKAMAKRPVDRFPNCTAFAKAARQALSGPMSPHPVHPQQALPAYPNPPAPQPNYPAPAYPAPGYPAPPQGGYPAPAVPPVTPNYPAPPQQQAPGSNYPAPNYPAPQPQPGAPGTAQPSGAPGYPAAPPVAGAAGYPQPAGWAPQPSSDAERVGSGPTVRPDPSAPEPAVTNYPAPQARPAPPADAEQAGAQAPRVGSGPTYRAPESTADDPSRRATDIVPQRVVSPEQLEDSAGQRTETLSQPAGKTATDPSGSGGSAGSPDIAELAAEPRIALAQPLVVAVGSGGAPVESPAADPMSPGDGGQSGSGAESPEAGIGAEMWASEPLTGTRSDRSVDSGDTEAVAESSSVDGHPGRTADESGDVSEEGAQSDSDGSKDRSGEMSRHPDSGAFVRGSGEGAVVADVGGDESEAAEPISAGAADAANGGAAGVPPGVVGGEPGYGSYGGVIPPQGPGYGMPPGRFGPNPVQPGLVPTSQRAEASQATALLVLGLAVVALVLLVVVAVVVVSG